MTTQNFKTVIFDVGANDGSSCFKYTEDPSTLVYAFEPTPHLLCNHLYPLQDCRANYIVIPSAISDYNGKANFNIAGHDDWGCSSLYEFSDGLNQTWPGRTDFYITETTEVDVIRMDTFIENNNIQEIHYMHCDTQGNDLKVLQSFGPYIDRLKSGVVEATKQNPLYKGVDNTLSSITDFLNDCNFIVTEISSNNGCPNEVNISFTR